MRFEPNCFIELCRHSGITLRREGPFLCYDYRHKRTMFDAELVETLRRHKDELMAILPDTCPQIDLFDPYN